MIFKRVAVLGSTGQVGRQLVRFFAPISNVVAVQRSSLLSLAECTEVIDFYDFYELLKFFENFKPDLVINACAFTAVDLAEEEIDSCYRINAKLPEVLADWCLNNGSWLLHYSTDYVFDGFKSDPYSEVDLKNPQNVYGKSKSKGDNAIQSIIPERHWIFRTSWVFGHGAKNFPKTMAKLIAEKNSIKVVSDQKGRPTSANWIAYASMLAAEKLIPAGIYNLTSGGPPATWYDVAEEIKKISQQLLKKEINCEIIPCDTSEYKTAAKRPSNSILKLNKIEDALFIKSPQWRTDLLNYLSEVLT